MTYIDDIYIYVNYIHLCDVYLYEIHLHAFFKKNDLRKEILKLGNEIVNRPVLSFIPPGVVNDVKLQYSFKGSETIILLPKQLLEMIMISISSFCKHCSDRKVGERSESEVWTLTDCFSEYCYLNCLTF